MKATPATWIGLSVAATVILLVLLFAIGTRTSDPATFGVEPEPTPRVNPTPLFDDVGGSGAFQHPDELTLTVNDGQLRVVGVGFLPQAEVSLQVGDREFLGVANTSGGVIVVVDLTADERNTGLTVFAVGTGAMGERRHLIGSIPPPSARNPYLVPVVVWGVFVLGAAGVLGYRGRARRKAERSSQSVAAAGGSNR